MSVDPEEQGQCAFTGPVLTGKGSAPSWITKPSMRCVRMWDLSTAWAGLLSPLCWLLLVFPLPEVMTGAQAAPHLSTQAAWKPQLGAATRFWTAVQTHKEGINILPYLPHRWPL